jgi:hypothetical protein
MTGTAVYGTVRTVVWEDGGGNPASYPIVNLNQQCFELQLCLYVSSGSFYEST